MPQEETLMRRLLPCLAALGLIVLALPGTACAAPGVALDARLVSILGHPDTGLRTAASTATAAEPGAIEGTVTEAAGAKKALGGITVYAVLEEPDSEGTEAAITNGEGDYRIPNLAPEEYKVAFAPAEATGFGYQYYREQSVPVNASLVNVEAGKPTIGINAKLTLRPLLTLAFASKLVVSNGLVTVRARCKIATCAGIIAVGIVHHINAGTLHLTTSRPLARGSFTLAAGETAAITMHLGQKGRETLARAPRHRVSATLGVYVRGGDTIQQKVLLSLATPKVKMRAAQG
jgi:hypothetical protein